jgi:hypothetical protein
MSRELRHWQEFNKALQRDLRAAASLDRIAPIGRWTHKGSFDTADGCEQFRLKLINLAKVQEIEIREKYPDGLPTLGTHLATESRCIASDDPRLARR